MDGVEESLALSFFPSLTKKCMLEQGRPICGHLSPEILVTENNKREKTGTNLGMKYKYKVVQIWPGLLVCKQVTVCPGHIWTTLYTHTATDTQFRYIARI